MVRGIVAAGGVAALLATGLSLLATQHWLLELLTHFRMQSAAACGALALAAVAVRRRRLALVLATLGVVNLGFMTTYLWPGAGGAQASPPSLRILAANVGLRNTQYHSMLELIGEARPDLIGLMEADTGWVGSLEALAAEYPFRISRPREDPFGLLLLSRYPLREAVDSPYVHDGVPTAIIAEVELEGGRTNVILAHVRSPMSRYKAAARNAQLEKLSAVLRDRSDRPGILLGDLNVTPWSPYFKRLERDSGLRSAARGHGYLPSWPTALSVMGIPIDHCLLSEGLRAETIRTGPDFGSDHRPLLVDVSLSGARPEPQQTDEAAVFDRE